MFIVIFLIKNIHVTVETTLDQLELFGMTSVFIYGLFKLPAEQINKKAKSIETFQYVSEIIFGRRLVDLRANVLNYETAE